MESKIKQDKLEILYQLREILSSHDFSLQYKIGHLM